MNKKILKPIKGHKAAHWICSNCFPDNLPAAIQFSGIISGVAKWTCKRCGDIVGTNYQDSDKIQIENTV